MNVIKKANVFLMLAVTGILLLSAGAFAQPTFTTVDPADPTNFNIDLMLQRIRNYFFGFVIVACVLMIIWGAFDMATSGGDETKVQKAKDRIKYASIGLIVGALASVIVSLLRVIIDF